LLVEDDPGVRDLSAQILTGYGYNVLTAENGVAGLRVGQACDGPIDLLLTDVVMPQMSGPELAEKLKGQRPDMRVLFASGYTRDIIACHEVTGSGDTFIRKPFSEDRLIQKVQALLGDHE
jgi:CheY-like chemotaxis protein